MATARLSLRLRSNVHTCRGTGISQTWSRHIQPAHARNSTRSFHVSAKRKSEDYEALVIGSGPAGTATVGNLLEQHAGKVLWVDRQHVGGKVTSTWTEVPSNTVVELFLAYAKAVEPFRKVIESTPKPNAVTELESLQQDKTCTLSYAGAMIKMLGDGLRTRDDVKPSQGTVIGANWSSGASRWEVEYKTKDSEAVSTATASRIVLATGASPTIAPIPMPETDAKHLSLEVVLKPSNLASTLPQDSDTVVTVIGGSHSAVLAIMNLVRLAQTSHPQLRMRWFVRNPLKYAVKKDGWILYDNTGLKGEAATFAKENLEDDKLPQSTVSQVLRKVDCSGGKEGEKAAYDAHFPGTTHIVHAVGMRPIAIPMLRRDGEPLSESKFDHRSGRFWDNEARIVPGLFGAGIAFPEQVTDPAGNVELAVGFLKFMRFLRRVVPEWVKDKGVS